MSGRWSEERAARWYAEQPWWVGCNFTPSTAVNQLEMWRRDTFDPDTIGRELGWAPRRRGLALGGARDRPLSRGLGARGDVVVEGRFARDEAFGATLAALRAPAPVFASRDETGTLGGAALLATWPRAAVPPPLIRLRPDESFVARLREHRARWRERVGGAPG